MAPRPRCQRLGFRRTGAGSLPWAVPRASTPKRRRGRAARRFRGGERTAQRPGDRADRSGRSSQQPPARLLRRTPGTSAAPRRSGLGGAATPCRCDGTAGAREPPPERTAPPGPRVARRRVGARRRVPNGGGAAAGRRRRPGRRRRQRGRHGPRPRRSPRAASPRASPGCRGGSRALAGRPSRGRAARGRVRRPRAGGSGRDRRTPDGRRGRGACRVVQAWTSSFALVAQVSRYCRNRWACQACARSMCSCRG